MAELAVKGDLANGRLMQSRPEKWTAETPRQYPVETVSGSAKEPTERVVTSRMGVWKGPIDRA